MQDLNHSIESNSDDWQLFGPIDSIRPGTFYHNSERIIGLASIDNVIIGLCPEITRISPEKRKCLGELIEAYFFGKQYILRLIEDMTNEETSDFIEGIGMLIKEQGISGTEELQAHFEEYIQSFPGPDICNKKTI